MSLFFDFLDYIFLLLLYDFLLRLSAEEFVEFSQALPSHGPVPRVELHLKGSPNQWLGWLEALEMDDLQIERAGIRAIYRRFHLPASDALSLADELTEQAS